MVFVLAQTVPHVCALVPCKDLNRDDMQKLY